MECITRTALGSFEETVGRLKELIVARGLTLFAVIEHDVAAATAGLKMRPCKVMVFGSPEAGAPVMIASPLAALDLPLKLLVWQDASGKTRVSHHVVSELQHRHGLIGEQAAPLHALEELACAVTGTGGAAFECRDGQGPGSRAKRPGSAATTSEMVDGGLPRSRRMSEVTRS